MIKFAQLCIVALSLSSLAFVGCGSGGETTVVKEVPPEPAPIYDDPKEYEEAMKAQMKK
jgi:hypothetical protein